MPNKNNNEESEIYVNDQNLLIRLDERTKTLVSEVSIINTKLDQKYVSQEEFKPVKKIVYSAVAIIGGSVLVALIALVVHTVK